MSPDRREKIRFFLIPAAVTVGVLLFALGFLESLAFHEQTGAVDFRNRVVAARQANLGHDPYVFKWNPSFPETLLDPSDEPDTRYTRMTSPPTTLAFQRLFAEAPYSAQKRANFALNWIALVLVAAWIAWRLRADRKTDVLGIAFVMLGTGIFAVSGVWQFHAERGQQYVYFALFLALAALPPSGRAAARGVRAAFSALAVFFRQTLGLAAFLSFRDEKPVRSLLVTGAIGAVLLLPVAATTPVSYWKNYAANTRDWYRRLDETHERIDPYLDVAKFELPAAVEGDPRMAEFAGFGVKGNPLYHYYQKLAGGRAPPYAAMLLLTLIAAAWIGKVLWRNREEAADLFALRFFSGVYVTDILLPAPRSGYNAVLFFPAILLALVVWSRMRPDERRLRIRLLPILVALTVSLSGAMREVPGTALFYEIYLFLAAILVLTYRPREPLPGVDSPRAL